MCFDVAFARQLFDTCVVAAEALRVLDRIYSSHFLRARARRARGPSETVLQLCASYTSLSPYGTSPYHGWGEGRTTRLFVLFVFLQFWRATACLVSKIAMKDERSLASPALADSDRAKYQEIAISLSEVLDARRDANGAWELLGRSEALPEERLFAAAKQAKDEGGGKAGKERAKDLLDAYK